MTYKHDPDACELALLELLPEEPDLDDVMRFIAEIEPDPNEMYQIFCDLPTEILEAHLKIYRWNAMIRRIDLRNKLRQKV